MSQKLNQLQKKIMRRVYYAFALRFGTHPLVIHGAMLAVGVFALSRFTHVAAIINNLSNIKVGDLDNYLFNSFTHAEVWTLLAIGIIFFTMISLNFSLKSPKMHTHMQTT